MDFEAAQSGFLKLKVKETMTSNSSLNRHLFKAAPEPGEQLTKDAVVHCRDHASSACTAICKLTPT